ncbi:hypothetical protein GUJ93_ZPchr0001g31980 [Zizania palustris]|uniref:Uncharacterized protein n=1 Tax=Zizania palustris TaxID=103762 RepID=A0A8J5R6U7_ZIZPA|nr:hypothetical protein GUJ93_ZPchr0001g31980 [Zizania palustris]
MWSLRVVRLTASAFLDLLLSPSSPLSVVLPLAQTLTLDVVASLPCAATLSCTATLSHDAISLSCVVLLAFPIRRCSARLPRPTPSRSPSPPTAAIHAPIPAKPSTPPAQDRCPV